MGRDDLAQMIANYQRQTPGLRPPGNAMTDSPVAGDWQPAPGTPFGGMDRWNWKNPNLPPMVTGSQQPTGMSQQDIDMAKGLYNSMRARGELPFDQNPPLPPVLVPGGAPVRSGGRY